MAAKKKKTAPKTTKKKRVSPATKTPSQTFKTKVAPEGENFLVKLPFDVRTIFGKARPPIVVTLNGYSFRSTVAVYGGESYIGIRRSNREAARLVPGKIVAITITADLEPRTIEPPKDLAAVLKKDAKLRAAWEALSFSHKREHVDALEQAKKPETRARRLAKTDEILRRD